MNPKMLHITDIHFWSIEFNPLLLLNKRFLGNANLIFKRRHHFHQEHADAFLNAALATNVKDILLGGDFTTTATEAEFYRAAEWLQRVQDQAENLSLVLGNHDVYTFESIRKQRFIKYLQPNLPIEGYPSCKTLPNGLSIVMAPTVCPNFLSSRGLITENEIAKVAKLVLECPPGPLVVLAHYPCLSRTYAYNSTYTRQLRNAAAFRQALGETGRPLLYLAGHVHRFSYVQDPEFPQISHLCTPAFFLHRPGSSVNGAFTEIHAGDSGYDVYLHEHKENWERSHQPICRIDGTKI